MLMKMTILFAAATFVQARYEDYETAEWEKYQCNLPMNERHNKVAW